VSQTALWNVGDLKKDETFRLELKLEMTRELLLKNMKKLSMCLKFDLPGLSLSCLKLLKVEFVAGHKDWKKYASEVVKSGFVEVELN
jgi:hypothetical protein